jgi:chromosome segregation ATPase
MLSQPFSQVALPLIVTILIAAFTAVWFSNKRIEEVSRRIDDINRRIDDTNHRIDERNRRIDRLESGIQDIKAILMSMDHRLTVLEERGAPLVRG